LVSIEPPPTVAMWRRATDRIEMLERKIVGLLESRQTDFQTTGRMMQALRNEFDKRISALETDAATPTMQTLARRMLAIETHKRLSEDFDNRLAQMRTELIRLRGDLNRYLVEASDRKQVRQLAK
jgi:hypothetical protein